MEEGGWHSLQQLLGGLQTSWHIYNLLDLLVPGDVIPNM